MCQTCGHPQSAVSLTDMVVKIAELQHQVLQLKQEVIALQLRVYCPKKEEKE